MLLETFIKGIEVMSKSEITEPTHSSLIIGFLIGAILYCVVYCLIDNEILGTLFGAFVFIICFVGVVALSIHPTGEYEYKVTISDEVSMNEFMKKYEIINQDGKIYTIKER